MKKEDVLELIVRHIREVVPELTGHAFSESDSLRALGANSVDRSEIIMMTLESLAMRVPMIEFARAENIGDLAGIFHGKLSV